MEQILKKKIFWKNKKVLITGHTGFKGSWLSIILNILEANVYGYSLKPKKNSLFEEANIKTKICKNYFRDINDFNFLEKIIKKHKPEIIFHLASEALVLDSFNFPYKTFKTNLMGTLNLLEIIKKSNFVKSAIFVTTDKVYKEKNNLNYSHLEVDELKASDPYGSSKVGQEILVNSYIKSFFNYTNLNNRVSTVRSGNVIGGGDYSKNRLIPDLLESLDKNKIFVMRNSKHVRPWQHVLEPLNGYLSLAQKQYQKKIKVKENIWNFGPNNKNFISVENVIKKVQNLGVAVNIKKIKSKNKKFLETDVLKLSSKKAKKYLNWKPKWNIEYTIKKILEWNKLKNNKILVYKICVNQIKEYFK